MFKPNALITLVNERVNRVRVYVKTVLNIYILESKTVPSLSKIMFKGYAAKTEHMCQYKTPKRNKELITCCSLYIVMQKPVDD